MWRWVIFWLVFWLFSCLRACVDMAQKLSFACVKMYDGLREGWHTSCYRNSSQEHIAVPLPCFLFCSVLFCLLGCFLCVLFFVVFVSFAFLLVCARLAIGLLYGLCKGPHQLSFVAFHACQFNFRQVKACVTTWRKPRRRWTEKISWLSTSNLVVAMRHWISYSLSWNINLCPSGSRSSSSLEKETLGGALIRTMIKGPSLPHFHLALATSRHGQA